MSEAFQKPFIDRPGVLDPTPGDPQGYVTKDGMWAAVPMINSKKFVIIHNGQQVHLANNYSAARTYIQRQIKTKKSKKGSATLEEFLG
jgi:hypothetical protein